ncbi:HAD family hydrolase [Paenibacillus sp. MBLB4367]|uniref:HAD family hydrolase n=1 Tax=Paenibacillus sp. MBLB4367 TaxID=3384767 RepID=UPI003907EF5A
MHKAVVFDLDDTLYPEKQFVWSGFRAVDHFLNEELHLEGFYDLAVACFEQGGRGTIFNRVLESLRFPYDDSLIKQLIDVYRSHRPNISLFDDARWAISFYAGAYRTGIITDGYLVSQLNKIDALQLRDTIDNILCTDMFGREHWKPSELPYLKMMSALDCVGMECVYVGDNPRKDFVTAKKLGWTTVQIIRSDGEYGKILPDRSYAAEYRMESLYSLKELIS